MRLLLCIGAASALFCCFWGCSRPAEVPALQPPAGSPQEVAQATAGTVQRYTTSHFAHHQQRPRESRPVLTQGRWTAQPQSEISIEGDVVVFSNPTGAPTATLRQHFSSREFNAIRLRMSNTSGDTLRVWWRSELEPDLDHAPSLTIPAIPNGQPHDYLFSFDLDSAPYWQGTIEELRFQLGSGAGEARVELLELVFAPPAGPARLSLAAAAREAIWGTLPPWTVQVPPSGRLKAAVGLLARAEARDGDGVRFSINAITPQGQRSVLSEKKVLPVDGAINQWHRLEADLSGYEGQTLTLEMSVFPLGNTKQDYAFWGDPLVFQAAPQQARVPVLLISCDTLRADHVSAYGYSRKTTPHLDALAQDAVLFEQCITPESWTPPAHMSMLTGLDPKKHGMNEYVNLPEPVTTVQELLQQNGYLTSGHVGLNWWLLPSRGFAQGFDLYTYPYADTVAIRNVFDTHAVAWDWITRQGDAPWFVFLHNYDIHSLLAKDVSTLPYAPPKAEFLSFSKAYSPAPDFARPELPDGGPKGTDFLAAANLGHLTISPEENEYMQALYDDAILGVDTAIGELLEQLRARGLYDQALIIVTADHGEAFGEHGKWAHVDVYEHTVHVPLIVKLPGNAHAGRRVPDLVSLNDLTPTILGVTGSAVPEGLDGRSLLRLLDGSGTGDDRVFVRWEHIKGVRTPEWKAIEDTIERKRELYRLTSDPEERNNLSGMETDVEDRLQAQVSEFFAAAAYGWNFVFSGGESGADITVDVAATAPLAVATLYDREHNPGNNDELYLSPGRNNAELSIQAQAREEDRLTLLPSGAGHELSIRLRSTAPMKILHGETPDTPVTEWTGQLRPQESTGTAPEIQRDGTPAVYLWYVAPPSAASPAAAPSEADQDALDALGYMDGHAGGRP